MQRPGGVHTDAPGCAYASFRMQEEAACIAPREAPAMGGNRWTAWQRQAQLWWAGQRERDLVPCRAHAYFSCFECGKMLLYPSSECRTQKVFISLQDLETLFTLSNPPPRFLAVNIITMCLISRKNSRI